MTDSDIAGTLYDKLGVSSRAGAAAGAVRHGGGLITRSRLHLEADPTP